jgi:hypothetical protein
MSGIHPDDFDVPGPPFQPASAKMPSQAQTAPIHPESPPASTPAIAPQYVPAPIVRPPASGGFKWPATIMAVVIVAFVVWISATQRRVTPIAPIGTPPPISAVSPSPVQSSVAVPNNGGLILDRRILGRWKQTNAEEDVLEPEFFLDGTMQQHNESGRFTGRYSFIDMGTVKIDGLNGPCGVGFEGSERDLSMTLKCSAGTEMRFKSQNAGASPNGVVANSLLRVTSHPSRDATPVWVAVNKILFLSNRGSDRANQNGIWETQPDGSGQREVVHVRVSTPPEWGDPGLGGHLELGEPGDVFVYEAQHFHEIMQIALPPPTTVVSRTAVDGNDGFFRVLLQVPGGQSASGIFYSRATRLAAWIARIPGQSVQIRSAPLASLNGQSATTHGDRIVDVGVSGSVDGLSFSPNGSELVAAICGNGCSVGGRGPDLYILDVRSGQFRVQLTNSGLNGIRNSSPRWSPNGQWIAFTSTSSGQEGIWLIKSDGTGLRQLNTASMKASAPAWSEDGAKLVFSAVLNGNEDIWIAASGVL